MAGEATGYFHSRLTGLQRAVLSSFFEREREFFLSGGAALAGYHLGHRETLDLDLFTTRPEAFDRGRFVLAEVAAALGASLRVRQDAPGFRRVVLERGELREWIDGLVRRLRRQAHPGP